MNEKLRKQLDQIDEWLCEPGGEDLSAVLSATRGPDDASDKFPTQLIRSIAFPKLAARANKCYDPWHNWAFAPPCSVYVEPTATGHYLSHIRMAATVLGLK